MIWALILELVYEFLDLTIKHRYGLNYLTQKLIVIFFNPHPINHFLFTNLSDVGIVSLRHRHMCIPNKLEDHN